MTIRKIHIPLIAHYGAEELKRGNEAALRVGLTLGRDFGAHVEVCCIAAAWHDPDELIASAIPGAAIQSLMSEIEKGNEKAFWLARSQFDAVAAAFRPQHDRVPDGEAVFSAEFLEVAGEIHIVAAERGKLADLNIITSAPKGQIRQYDLLLQTLLADTGRPLLIVPEACDQVALGRVAIAWNDTNEASRALAMNMDFIRQAEAVVIITVLEDGTPPSGPQALADYLRWHGVEATVVEVPQTGQGVAGALLHEAEKAQADLLIMGAYTRGKLRRIVFGGATGGVLAARALPLLLVD